MLFGVDYYPEHWPRSRWTEDAKLMRDAGINVVRMAEFAWSLLEPKEGRFEFQWLDDAVSILADHGIKTIMCTPTASPPPWVMEKPEITFRHLPTGQAIRYGGRRGYCPSNSSYRDQCAQVASEMANHYGSDPNVVGWQIDNEFGGRCHCEICRTAFQRWLSQRYRDISELNDAWGNVFWSQIYDSFDQIPVPIDYKIPIGYGHNPGLELDFNRFCSATVRDFQQIQIDVLRPACNQQFITHNSGFGFEAMNFYEISENLDFVSLDYYDRFMHKLGQPVDPYEASFTYEMTYGFKNRSYLLTELQGGMSGWKTFGSNPRPGEIPLWSYQAISHGALGIIYFRWRSALVGAEQYTLGVLDHDAKPRRRYAEVKKTGHELARIGDQIQGLCSRAQVAIINSCDSLFSFQGQPNHPDFNYFSHVRDYYRALAQQHITVDVIPPDRSLSSYKLVVVPALYVLEESTADSLREFVSNGGVLLVTARSGAKDQYNRVVDTAPPGLLAEICGIEVEEFEPIKGTVPIELALPDAGVQPSGCTAELWCDVLACTTAEVVGTYQDGYYEGQPAVTVNSFGTGRVLYAGTLGNDALHQALVQWALSHCGINPAISASSGVEVSERWDEDRRVLFTLNHSDSVESIELDGTYRDLVSEQPKSGKVDLAPKQVMVLVEAD